RQDKALPNSMQRALAAIAIVALGPILIAIAIAVRFETPGPALFPSRRLGLGGTPFIAWKFRTMYWETSDVGSGISGPADTRVTRIGSALRRARLDELPQLWNVLRGEMPLVCPRPEDPAFVDP